MWTSLLHWSWKGKNLPVREIWVRLTRCSNYQVLLLLIFLAYNLCAYAQWFQLELWLKDDLSCLIAVLQEMQLLLPYAQFTKDDNCRKMQSNSAQAYAQMSRCCTAFITPFRNVLTCKLLNKTLSTLCKYWCRNGKELVDQVLQGHHWSYLAVGMGKVRTM